MFKNKPNSAPITGTVGGVELKPTQPQGFGSYDAKLKKRVELAPGTQNKLRDAFAQAALGGSTKKNPKDQPAGLYGIITK